MKQSLYLETTIPSYLAARTSSDLITAGRQAITHEFWEFERNKYNLYISGYIVSECGRGDPEAAKRRLQWIDGIELLDETPNTDPLADTYMRLLTIPQKKQD